MSSRKAPTKSATLFKNGTIKKGNDGNNWVNKGGSVGGFISLGNASNVQITGGAINYVLTTDGLGNLSWTPKGALYTPIINLTPDASNTFGYGANAVIMEVNFMAAQLFELFMMVNEIVN